MHGCRENKDFNLCMDQQCHRHKTFIHTPVVFQAGHRGKARPSECVLACFHPLEDDLFSPPSTVSLQGLNMPAAEGPLSPPMPQHSGQKTKPVCTSSIHQSARRPRLAPASPRAPTLDSSGPTVAFRPTEAPAPASTLSSLGTLPSTLRARRKATVQSTT